MTTVMKYETTWLKGMNTRPDHNVNNSPNGVVPYGEVVEVTEIWIAPFDGINVKKNDKWAKLKSNITQWVAVVHLGVVYGIVTNEDVSEPPTTTFPESFVLTDPSGAQAEYVFVRIIK